MRIQRKQKKRIRWNKVNPKFCNNGQPAAKFRTGKGSTTIPFTESRNQAISKCIAPNTKGEDEDIVCAYAKV